MIGKNISSHRCEHSIRVARLAYEIALRNNIDNPIKAYVAGLLHDVAKDLSKEDALDLMSQYFPEYIDMPSWSYHQFLSGVLVRKLFNINDEVVVEAMKYHASGNENMSTLGKIIYSSDKIEPGRGFDSSGLINACLDNYDAGFIEVLKANKEYLMSKKSDISNRLTDKCFKFYL